MSSPGQKAESDSMTMDVLGPECGVPDDRRRSRSGEEWSVKTWEE